MKMWIVVALMCLGFQARAVDVIEKEGQELVLISQEAAESVWELFLNKELTSEQKQEAYVEIMTKEAIVDGDGTSFCEVAARVYGAKEQRESSLLRRCPRALVSKDLSSQMIQDDAPYKNANDVRELISMSLALLILL